MGKERREKKDWKGKEKLKMKRCVGSGCTVLGIERLKWDEANEYKKRGKQERNGEKIIL